MEYRKNFMRKDCAELEDGDILTRCNVSQEKAHTELKCKGKKITFRLCNMKNVEEWPEMVLEGKNYLVGVHEDVVNVIDDPAEIAARQIEKLKAKYGESVVTEAAKIQLPVEDKKITAEIR